MFKPDPDILNPELYSQYDAVRTITGFDPEQPYFRYRDVIFTDRPDRADLTDDGHWVNEEPRLHWVLTKRYGLVLTLAKSVRDAYSQVGSAAIGDGIDRRGLYHKVDGPRTPEAWTGND